MKILIGAALMAAFMLAGGAPAQAADGPCFAGGRYCDGGNGTVTDTVTGLIWLKQVNCLPLTYWQNANEIAKTIGNGVCGLTDGSHPGDWRLPTATEWQTTIARAVGLGCHTLPVIANRFTLTDSMGTKCVLDPTGTGSPFIGLIIPTPPPGPVPLDTRGFWSSQTDPSAPNAYAMRVRMNLGMVSASNRFPGDLNMRVWLVRNGLP